MSDNNKRKAEFLGMPYGTASNRLKKMLMFRFAQELGYDTCYSCEELIETVDDLSVEHKEPWLDREDGVRKFWDLDNIAFSHLSCNRPHRSRGKGGGWNKKVGPRGTAWCKVHGEFLPIGMFSKHKGKTNGVYYICKDCRRDIRASV